MKCSFDVPITLLNGSRGKSMIEILKKHGFVQDVMNHPTLGDDPIHFTHKSWGSLSSEEKEKLIRDAQSEFSSFNFPKLPGSRAVTLPRGRRQQQCK